jgi:hypothetical protein
VERRRLDPLLDRPVHRAVEDVGIVLVHAEDEARVDHHPEVVQPPHGSGVVVVQVLELAAGAQGRRVQRLEAHEEAAQAGLGRTFEEPGAQHRLDRARRLPEPSHAAHTREEGAGETRVAQQVVVEEVEMSSREPLDLPERGVHTLGVEAAAPGEEGVLVAEVTVVRTPPRHHDGVGDEVALALDEVAPHRREPVEGPFPRPVDPLGPPRREIGEEGRPGVLAGADEEGVGVRRGLLGQRGDVQTSERDVDPPAPVVVREPVRPRGRGDVDLDHHQVRAVVDAERLDVLVLQVHLGIGRQVARQRGEAEGRKQRVLDRPEERAQRLGQRRQDHLHAHGATSGRHHDLGFWGESGAPVANRWPQRAERFAASRSRHLGRERAGRGRRIAAIRQSLRRWRTITGRLGLRELEIKIGVDPEPRIGVAQAASLVAAQTIEPALIPAAPC